MKQTEFLTWDDETLIKDNPTVNEGLGNFSDALTDQTLGLWHPATIWSHQLDVSLLKMNPDLHHLSAILYHLLAGLALFYCLKQMRIGSKAVSLSKISILITVSLFLFHPMHVESWAWLSERKDTLSAIFGFLSLGFWFKYINHRKSSSYYLALGFLALGLMSKPILVVWPAILFISGWINSSRRESLGITALKLLPFMALAVCATFITLAIQHSDEANKLQVIQTRGLVDCMLAGMNNLGLYLYKLFIPINLSYNYVPLVIKPYLGCSISLFIFGFAGSVSYKYRRKAPILGWGLCAYLILLIPVCGFIISGESNAPDRYSYLAYLGPFLIIAMGYQLISKHWTSVTRNTLAIFIFCLLPGWFSIQRSLDWRTMVTLTAATLEHTPDHPYALMHLANYKRKKGEITEAVSLYEHSLRGLPNNRYHWTTLGLLYQQLKQDDKAEQAFLKQLKYHPATSTPFLALAQESLNKQDRQGAIDYLKQALSIFPNDKEAKRVLIALTDEL